MTLSAYQEKVLKEERRRYRRLLTDVTIERDTALETLSAIKQIFDVDLEGDDLLAMLQKIATAAIASQGDGGWVDHGSEVADN